MTRWEYVVKKGVRDPHAQDDVDRVQEAWLNEMGEQGFELVQVRTMSRGPGTTLEVYFYFKRPKLNPAG